MGQLITGNRKRGVTRSKRGKAQGGQPGDCSIQSLDALESLKKNGFLSAHYTAAEVRDLLASDSEMFEHLGNNAVRI